MYVPRAPYPVYPPRTASLGHRWPPVWGHWSTHSSSAPAEQSYSQWSGPAQRAVTGDLKIGQGHHQEALLLINYVI